MPLPDPSANALSSGPRKVEIGLTCTTLVAFALPILGAGCGIAPIGLILFAGSFDPWGTEMAISWVGIAFTIFSLFGKGRAIRLALATFGLVLLCIAFARFVHSSKAGQVTLITGAPFLVCSLMLLVKLLWACFSRPPGRTSL